MTEGIERPARPKEVGIGVAILAAIYLYGLYGAIAGGLLSADWSQAISRGLLSFAITPVLILGIWLGFAAARLVNVVLFLGWLVTLAGVMTFGAKYLPGALGFLVLAAHAAGLVLLFLPPSNAWFRAWKQARRRSALYPVWLAIGIVFGIPLVVVLLLGQGGPMMGGPGTVLFLGLVYLMFIPAVIFGRPHFMFGIGAGPADATGVMLTIVFYAFIATVLAAVLWHARRGGSSGGKILVAAAVAMLAVMAVPVVRDRSALKGELRVKVAEEQAKRDAALAGYPELEGPFTIRDEGGQFGIKSSGRWKIAKGQLEIVADTTEIWNRFPRCTACQSLKSWNFALKSASGTKSPWLGVPERRTGFAAMTGTAGSGPDGKIVVTGHRMVVPIAEEETVSVFQGDRREEGKVVRYLPPSVLANYWIGITLEYSGEANYPISADNAFLFADALAEKGLVPARCAAPRNIADAVERACHEELARMLQDPERRAGIEKGDKDLRTYSRESTPLQIAVWMKDAKLASLLLENGANPNQTDIAGYTLLMTAVTHGADEVVAALVKHKANLNEQYTRHPGQDAGKTALILAAAQGGTEAIKLLLAAGADKSIKARDGHNAYEHAAYFKHPEAAALLK